MADASVLGVLVPAAQRRHPLAAALLADREQVKLVLMLARLDHRTVERLDESVK